MDRSILDTHEASDSESWLLNDGFDPREAFLKNNSGKLLGGGGASKQCCAKCFGCVAILLLVVILAYGIFLAVVFGGVPQMHLMSFTPQCRDSGQCMSSAGQSSNVPFKAVFNVRNPNRMDVRINADVKLFKTDGVTQIGDGVIRWAPLAMFKEEERGRNKGLLNQIEATIYVRSSAISREWLDFFFREGTKVFSKPRLSTTILPLPASIQQLAQPSTFNMVILTTVTLRDICFWLPEMTSDEFIMIGDPTRSSLPVVPNTPVSTGVPLSLADPNFANSSPLPPSNVDASLPWAATAIGDVADSVLPMPTVYSQAGGFAGNVGFNLREKEGASKDHAGYSLSPTQPSSIVQATTSENNSSNNDEQNKTFDSQKKQSSSFQKSDQGQLNP